ncbi:MAG: protein kinase [Ardenticatenaceae bacterium]|nr:protein kinase [Ardenticatenaceae bacterium]MCB9444291.1 protein kinase [Ardenticatenaceae bacterium]
MAEVYKSTHPDLGRDIAVKILHPFHTQVPGFIGRFRLEAQAAASLHHPNIVQVYDFAVSDDGLYYMVMQYINGLSLEEYLTLEKAPLTLTKAFWFFRQIANALDFAHKRGTIHRDVKPANIMLDTRENAYLSDFGLAKIVGVDRQTLSGMSPGTPSYMAPEHISGREVTSAVDIYALGVILYRMLTNRLPYEGDNLMTIITRALTEPAIPPRTYNPAIPQPVEDIILKAMAEDPEDRFVDAAAMSRALATALAEAGEIIPEQSKITPVGVVPLPGLQLDNYKVKREFIRDSSGLSKRYFQRYLAHNVALDSQAVLTVLKTSADEDSHFVNRFQKRMEKLTLLDHPGLAAITRIDKTPSNQPYVAYEFIPGNSLETEMVEWNKGEMRLPAVEVLNLVRRVAEPLNLVHKAGLVHNDLRPGNIIIQADKLPVLVGLEIPIAPDAAARSDAGKSVDYASPEQLEGNPLCEQSNIYSLGIILYELFAGHRPLLDWDHLGSHNLPRPVDLEKVRRGLADETYLLVKDCLAQEITERIEDIDQFMHRLDRAEAAEIALQASAGQESLVWRRVFTAVPIIAIILSVLAYALLRGQASTLADGATAVPVLFNEPTVTATRLPASPTRMLPSPTMAVNAIELSGDSVEPTATSLSSPTSMPMVVVSPASTLALPPKPSAVPEIVCEKPETWVVYTVQEGEVLFNLALETGSTVDAVKQVNCLTSNILSIGQVLWLPMLPPTATPTSTSTSTPLPTAHSPRSTPTKTPPPPPQPATATATP